MLRALTLKKLSWIVGACTLAFSISLLDMRLRQFLPNHLNTASKLVLFKAENGVPSLEAIEVAANHFGLSADCSHEIALIDGASSALRSVRSPKVNSTYSFSEEDFAACLLRTEISVADYLKRHPHTEQIDRILSLPEIQETDHFIFTAHSFSSYRFSADVLVSCVLTLTYIAASFLFVSWSADLKNMLVAFYRAPYLLVLPKFLSNTVKLLFGTAHQLLFSVQNSHHLFFILVDAPISEEIIYRLLIFELVKKYSGPIFATLFASFLFAISHDFDLTGLVGSFIFGLTLQCIYVRFKSLSLCVASHFVGNAIAISL
jgi:membrane protease YdiL (CAAX protease family)